MHHSNPLSSTGVKPCRITAVLTCFNRKTATLECLERLSSAAKNACVALSAVLVDDGSTDGTAECVSAKFAWVDVLHGDGALFWNRGMHLAQQTALKGEADYLLWMNDDSFVCDDSLTRLLKTSSELSARYTCGVIVVGAMADASTGRITYGGQVSIGWWRRFTFQKVWDETRAVECEVMNGNMVLLPMPVVQRVGNLDPVFAHGLGDFDYALRARKLGVKIFVAPGIVGYCSNNARAGTFLDRAQPLRVRWRKMMHAKGLPPRSWLRFTRRHGGLLWPLFFIWPYIRVLFQARARF